MKDVIVITGPTASGKTGVSIELAKSIDAEIINADSMQIYKKCDIGTAKPTLEEISSIPHHLIDIAEPSEEFSVASYKENAEKSINDIFGRGKQVVITGGTGLYIDALVKNLDFKIDGGLSQSREKYKQILNIDGVDSLYSLLVKRDSDAAASVHPNNTRRVIRYLEILDGYNGSLADYMLKTRNRPSEFNFQIFVLWPEREFIYKRIEKRIDEMLAKGLVNEVRGLLESGINSSMQSMQGIGYKETIQFIEGKLSYVEFVEILKQNTRRYAKRQFTWMNRYKEAIRIPIDEYSGKKEISKEIQAYFKK